MYHVLRINGIEVFAKVGEIDNFNKLVDNELNKICNQYTPMILLNTEQVFSKVSEPSVISGILEGKAEGLIPACVVWVDENDDECMRVPAFIGTVKEINHEELETPKLSVE